MCYPFLPVHCGEPGRHCAILERGARRGSPSSSGCGRLETGTVASILRPPGKTVRGKAKTPWLAEQKNEKNGGLRERRGIRADRVSRSWSRQGREGWLASDPQARFRGPSQSRDCLWSDGTGLLVLEVFASPACSFSKLHANLSWLEWVSVPPPKSCDRNTWNRPGASHLCVPRMELAQHAGR